MTKPELGTKRRCANCDAKFFDLNKAPIVCPMCTAVFVPPRADPVPSRRGPDRQALPAKKVIVPKELNEEGISAKEDDEEAVLLDDQGDDVDATEIIGAEIGKDDT